MTRIWKYGSLKIQITSIPDRFNRQRITRANEENQQQTISIVQKENRRMIDLDSKTFVERCWK
jgi:hypothetical protein